MSIQTTPASGRSDHLGRSPDSIRTSGNHLVKENSRYLLDHAHNPVDWYPWGKQALERARALDKPIFLSIGYSSCHWCHVMEREVFENDTIADFLNRHYVSIKIDREERPDLDEIYMDAVVAMTGSGGWPLSVFLTPNKEPFFGGTYFPPDHFIRLIDVLAKAYQTNKTEIRDQAKKVVDFLNQSDQFPASTRPGVDFDIIVGMAKQVWDLVDGGFRAKMKFPMPVRWQTLLHIYRSNQDSKLADMIKLTLTRMASGGIHDHVGGGFHRYATDSEWMIPHFEKMLYDNAQLAELYLEAAVVFDDQHFARVAKATIDFLLAEMWSPDTGFYASMDADVDGQEGSTYLWTPKEILQASDDKLGPGLAALLGVTETGNFEGKNVLSTRTQAEKVARDFHLEVKDVDGLFEKYRLQMLALRRQRPQPRIDTKVVTSWNGMTIAALAKAYRYFGDERYRTAAEKAMAYIERVHSNSGGLYRVSNAGQAANDGVLDDYSFVIRGLIELYQATGNVQQLKKALALAEAALEGFGHADGLFYMTHVNSPVTLSRRLSIHDGVRPSGSAVMLQNLARLEALTGQKHYRQIAEKGLHSAAELMRMQGLDMSGWFDAALSLEKPMLEVVICGDRTKPDTLALIEKFNSRMPAHAVISLLPAQGPSEEQLGFSPSLKGKKALSGQATAFVCEQQVCQKPTHDPEHMEKQLFKDWQ